MKIVHKNIKYMPKTSTDSGYICLSYRKSWSLNTMVTADFRLEASK